MSSKIRDFWDTKNVYAFFREWKNRNITTQKEFAILTNEISKASFGKTVGEYREL